MPEDLQEMEELGERVQPPLKFPHCVVWTPIPLLTWLLPVVGHMGICSADGTIHDFAGPFYVNSGRLAFGHPTRCWQLDPALAAAPDAGGQRDAWDAALQATRREFEQRDYSFLSCNCHSFVGAVLSRLRYGGRPHWGMAALAAGVAFRGRFVGVGMGGAVRTWRPFLLLLALALALGLGFSR